jgi:hypothetical protein
MIRPPPPPCTVCGRSHDAAVHTSPEAAALERRRRLRARGEHALVPGRGGSLLVFADAVAAVEGIVTERVAIVGSRAHPNLELVREYVRSLPLGAQVISGGAVGVDQAASSEASRRDAGSLRVWPLVITPGWVREIGRMPEMSEHDALLGRNTLIAIACTRMVVFPDGSKGGCWDAAREAVRFKRPVEVRWANGEVQPFGASMQKRIASQLLLDDA